VRISELALSIYLCIYRFYIIKDVFRCLDCLLSAGEVIKFLPTILIFGFWLYIMHQVRRNLTDTRTRTRTHTHSRTHA
jgi:hypothetical protein